jgi:predicted metal-binding protein
LKEIGGGAFYYSEIKSIRIPNNVENIGKDCFCGCKSLCEVVFESESKLKEIGDCTFSGSGVNTIEIPDQCERLDGNSLYGLEFVSISKGNKFLILQDDLLLKTDGNILIRYFGKSNRIFIKNFFEIISGGCFRGCNYLCEVVFESDSKLKQIGDCAFYHSGIKSIRIPNNVEKIENNCFSMCESLCEIVFESESKLKEIGDYAFSESGIISIGIPNNVEKIGKNCFHSCKYLCEVTFEGSASIGFQAFCNCPLRCINVARDVVWKYKFPEFCTIHEIDLSKNE